MPKIMVSFTLQIMMCRYSPHVVSLFSLTAQPQLKKLTAAGQNVYLSIVLQLHSVHYPAFFTVMSVRLPDRLTAFASLVTRVS